MAIEFSDMASIQHNLKIVLTGGPGGGKTTALDLFRREFHDRIVIVPESATTLFQNGIKRSDSDDRQRKIQSAIYKLQCTFEEIYREVNQDKLLICDRGTLDGLAYWPDSEEDFFKAVNSSMDQELARYDAVIFFQTAAACGDNIKSNNPHRIESSEQATKLDEKLRKVWCQHPNFHYVDSSESFLKKIYFGIQTINHAIKNA
jgi:thymidylate kinase